MKQQEKNNPGYLSALLVCLTGSDVVGYLKGLIKDTKVKIYTILGNHKN